MLIIAGVLDAQVLSETRALAETLAWQDGARTAGASARGVKRNLQADLSSRTGAALREQLSEIVEDHPVIRAAAQPRRFSRLMLSKTEAGGGYGLHIDNAFMGSGSERLRTDLSFTLFLSDPESYAGGELEIELQGETRAFKPPAGDLVLYPSTTLHRVAPVTEGVRLVCIGWIQSLIADPMAREILFDLENLRASLAHRYGPQTPERLTLSKVISNLLRLHGR